MATPVSNASQLDASTLKVIGIGPAFPLSFSGSGGVSQLTLADGIDKINMSLFMLLTTSPGDRVMNPEYGAGLVKLLFEPNDNILRDLCYLYVVDAIARWEKRIKLLSVNFPLTADDQENGVLRLQLSYLILQTNQIGNFVFPFQRNGEPMSQLVTGSTLPGFNTAARGLVQPIVIGQIS